MSERAGLAAVLCALAMACGGDGGERASGASVYFVPPRGPASEYAVTDVSWRVEGGVARLDYTLPRLLVGMSQRVSLEGPVTDGVVALTGPVGSASCTRQPSAGLSLRCEERFPGLVVDLDGVRREAMRVDPAHAQARVDVATRFSIEPIGVLELASQ
jgi:hypothetical protein